jgi:hypothetical protein
MTALKVESWIWYGVVMLVFISRMYASHWKADKRISNPDRV